MAAFLAESVLITAAQWTLEPALNGLLRTDAAGAKVSTVKRIQTQGPRNAQICRMATGSMLLPPMPTDTSGGGTSSNQSIFSGTFKEQTFVRIATLIIVASRGQGIRDPMRIGKSRQFDGRRSASASKLRKGRSPQTFPLHRTELKSPYQHPKPHSTTLANLKIDNMRFAIAALVSAALMIMVLPDALEVTRRLGKDRKFCLAVITRC